MSDDYLHLVECVHVLDLPGGNPEGRLICGDCVLAYVGQYEEQER